MKILSMTPRQEWMDRAGLVLSTLCLIHCTALPLLLAVLQAYGTTLIPKSVDNELFHVVLAFVLLGVGGMAFVSGYLRHRRWSPVALGALGTFLLFVGAFNPAHLFPEWGEHAVTVLGTVALLVAHAKNRKPSPGHHCHDESCAGNGPVPGTARGKWVPVDQGKQQA